MELKQAKNKAGLLEQQKEQLNERQDNEWVEIGWEEVLAFHLK